MKTTSQQLVILTISIFGFWFGSAQLNHIQLVHSWAPTYCRNLATPCNPKLLTAQFLLHGLWPASQNGALIVNCNTTATGQMLREVYQTLGASLSGAWPSIIKGPTNEAFWDHEWYRHGSCSNMTPLLYFQSAIRERNRINLLSALAAFNITPSIDRTYTKANILNAIRQRITNNNNIYISCRSRNTTHVELNEIYICLDTTATNYFSCPSSTDTRGCGGTGKSSMIIFPRS